MKPLPRALAITFRRREAAAPARSVHRPWRWVLAGMLLGATFGVLRFAPASWLTGQVAAASDGRVLLADARGTVWTGSAVAVLAGGPGSRDAALLPGRLRWKLRLAAGALELRLVHDCCLEGEQRLSIEPGIGRLRLAFPAGPRAVGHWPASLLAGLGTPWNTLRLGGTLRLFSDSLVVETVQGRWRIAGRAHLELRDLSSHFAPLPQLGSYRLDLAPGAAGATLTLATIDGALQMSGQGEWSGDRLRFRGEARAAAGAEPVLNNLLNLLGRRQGALALLSIG